jgi:hypothetical protein
VQLFQKLREDLKGTGAFCRGDPIRDWHERPGEVGPELGPVVEGYHPECAVNLLPNRSLTVGARECKRQDTAAKIIQ